MRLQRWTSLAFALTLAALTRTAGAQAPANPHGALNIGCSNCHSPDAWKPASISASFRHAEAVFPLDGAHTRTACLTCHRSLDFSRAPVACASCHNDIHNGELGTQCSRCHTTRGFTDLARMRTAHEATRFPLRGAHAGAQCSACHSAAQPGQMQFAGRPTTCVACHAENYRTSRSPDHQAAQFSQDCASCHTVSSWAGARFDHSTTGFPLDGGHRTVACSACHADGVYVARPTACSTCHMANFNTAANPPHAAAGFPTTCTTCHTTATWMGAPFDHATTQFPLTGAHATAICASCHADGVFRGRATTCISCHQTNYNAAQLPPHSALGFSTACATCHTNVSWQPGAFDHSTTQFLLTGAHRTVNCQDCHADRVYRGKPSTCVSCHQGVYDRSVNPPHRAGGFSTSCTNCHSTTAWRGAPFDHTATQFPLTGAHLAAACTACHADGVYHGKPTACATCHQGNYAATRNPPHASSGFPTTCQNCHTTSAWLGSPFDHSTTQFPLTGGHRAAACSACHSDGVYHGKSSACVTCHQANYTATRTPPHAASGFPTTCQTCHTTTAWLGSPFNHATTAFPLTGAHTTTLCTACHGDGVYHGKPTTCISCHQSKYNAALLPPHSSLAFSTTCTTCHTTVAWQPATFNHATTQFPLTGGHLAVSCSGCHADNVYRGKPSTCVACHQAKYTATRTPPHAASGFPTTCQTCHTTTAWLGSPFNHATTAFPLTGAHVATLCAACHGDGVYHGKPTTCISCHQPDYNTALLPPHSSLAFSTTCTTCHTTVGWQPATFNHATTRFALTGGHLAVSCNGCHADRVYRGKPMACVACHQAKYTATRTPPHAASGFPTTCETCHSTTAWLGSPFNHAATAFPLTGAHVATLCAACHGDGVYHGKPTTCISCHQPDYNTALLPPHSSLTFSTTCTTCHTTVGWQPATYNHSTTRFPLTGGHLAVSCNGCHADNVYRGKPMACVTCHQAKYTATRTPPHASSGFPTTCETCHSTASWLTSTFNHAATLFPLTGAHVTTLCASCHGDGVYKGKPTTCISCHQTDYNTALLPPHSSLAFSTTCTTCHTTVGWQPATFNHATTLFPLTGGHLAASCNDCHADKVYKGKPTTCVSCHQAKYTATTNPPHAAAGFATTCQNCHTTTAWTGATFNHGTTRFPLTGAHLTVACSSCHGDGVYRGKTMVCSGCHLTKYNATTNPKHSTAGFPTTCEGCHNTSTWLGATFNHDASFFPIYSGAHKGRWSVCADCHTSSSNYGVFTCLTCHIKSTMDSKHRGRTGYAYDSPTCYSCHPRGKAG